VDTWQAFCGPGVDGNDYAQVYAALTPFQKLANDTQTALLLVHHTKKSGTGEDVTDLLGSTAHAGVADCIWLLTGPKKGPWRLGIEGRGTIRSTDLDIRRDELTLTWQLADRVLPGEPTVRDRIVAAIEEAPGAELAFADLVALLDVAKGNLGRELSALVRLGKLHKPARGVYALPGGLTASEP